MSERRGGPSEEERIELRKRELYNKDTNAKWGDGMTVIEQTRRRMDEEAYRRGWSPEGDNGDGDTSRA